jgi:GNAT superfamily N-acetyltransferase
MAKKNAPSPPEHRLVRLLREAAQARFPRADVEVEVLGSPPGRSDAVVAFTAHSVVAAGVDPIELRAHLPPDDPGGPMSAPFLTWLGRQLGTPPGSLDVVLVADGTVAPTPELLLEKLGPSDIGGSMRDRAERARLHRSGVAVYSDEHRNGVVIIGRGLANRLEVSIEVAPGRRGRGIGASLARAALGLVPAGEALYAQVAPGNVASLRAFLRAGYRPIGSEVLFLRPG